MYRGYEAFKDMVEGGVDSAQDIADAMGVNKATVSKWVKKGTEDERDHEEGRTLKWIG